MGLIRVIGDVIGAGTSALSGAYESMVWKEYFVSGDMSGDILMKRAEKVLTGKSKNTRADDNLISSGSGIDVQEGQCMIIVDNGRIVDFCTEPGRYTYDASSQPSLYAGENKGLKAFGKEILNQWSTGGQRFSTQRVYFINMGRIWQPILWGLGNVGFTHSFQPNPNINPIRLNVMMKCHGSVALRIENPVNFYKEIGSQLAGGDNNGMIRVSALENTLFKTIKHAVSSAVSSAIAGVSKENVVAYTQVMDFADQISEKITEKLSDNSLVQSGFGFYDFYIDGNPEISEKDYNKIMEMEEKYNMVADPMLASYDIQKTMAEGFRNAGDKGGMQGFYAAGMTMGMGGMGGFGQFQQAPSQPVQAQPQVAPHAAAAVGAVAGAAAANSWTCSCGTTNTGKFCHSCGTPKPAPQPSGDSWTCACGATNTGRFCPNCGSAKPVKKVLKCDKCGWVAPEGTVTRFCPECGDPVTEADFQ